MIATSRVFREEREPVSKADDLFQHRRGPGAYLQVLTGEAVIAQLKTGSTNTDWTGS